MHGDDVLTKRRGKTYDKHGMDASVDVKDFFYASLYCVHLQYYVISGSNYYKIQIQDQGLIKSTR